MNHSQIAAKCGTTRAKHQGQGMESVNICLFHINNRYTFYARAASVSFIVA